ncbi:MAG: stalk domain-containing protein [Dysosmobacter sp.]|jgi:hypothetical protein|uniref:stalk domain-containing protein n=1 Tax=Dysosmobacter sp. TaxID=2591382 RepID=UPI003D941AF7
MKRTFSWMLTLVMALTLCVPALAAAPERPGWVKDWEYTVFEADDVYTGETWQIVERLRSDAAAGNLQPKKGDDRYEDWLAGEKTGAPAALRFELGLIGVQYTLNAGKRTAVAQARRYFGLAQDTYLDEGGTRDDATYNLLTLWYLRAGMVECSPDTNQTFSGLVLEEFLDRSGYTMEQFRDCPLMDLVTEADWATIQENLPAERAEAELAKTRAKVTLDGNRIDTENLARVVNGRTMIPVRCLAEQMGADVSYDSTLKAARIVRAGVEIIMPIGSKTCTVNGEPFQMDVAPYIENGRTMIPARYVSELFGQNIQWISDTRTAAVTENKALAGDTNLEQWAMAMGAYLGAANNGGNLTVFGGKGRGQSYSKDVIGQPMAMGTVYTYEWARYMLEDGWSIHDRAELIQTVCAMTVAGHNASFLHDVDMISSMTDAQYRALLSQATGMDAYMFPYTKALGEKWGERGILCWDLFRMSNLVQWGYAAGYLTYPEALALLEPAAAALRENFSSWEEACENYLDGYNWWAREDVGSKDPWTVTRGPYLKNLMEKNPAVFDDTLFSAPIKGVDGISAETLLASVQAAA